MLVTSPNPASPNKHVTSSQPNSTNSVRSTTQAWRTPTKKANTTPTAKSSLRTPPSVHRDGFQSPSTILPVPRFPRLHTNMGNGLLSPENVGATPPQTRPSARQRWKILQETLAPAAALQQSPSLTRIQNAENELKGLCDIHDRPVTKNNALELTQQLCSLRTRYQSDSSTPTQHDIEAMSQTIAHTFFGLDASHAELYTVFCRALQQILKDFITEASVTLPSPQGQKHTLEEETFLTAASMLIQLMKSRGLSFAELGDFKAVRGDSMPILKVLSKRKERHTILQALKNDDFRDFLSVATSSITPPSTPARGPLAKKQKGYSDIRDAFVLFWKIKNNTSSEPTNKDIFKFYQELRVLKITEKQQGILDVASYASSHERWTPLVNQCFELGAFGSKCTINIELAQLPNYDVFHDVMKGLTQHDQNQVMQAIADFKCSKDICIDSLEAFQQFKHVIKKQCKLTLAHHQKVNFYGFAYSLFIIQHTHTLQSAETIRRIILSPRIAAATVGFMRHSLDEVSKIVTVDTTSAPARSIRERIFGSSKVLPTAPISRKRMLHIGDVQLRCEPSEKPIPKVFSDEYLRLCQRKYIIDLTWNSEHQRIQIHAKHPYAESSSI